MERAVEWLFSHPDDDGSDSAPTTTAAATKAPLDGVEHAGKYIVRALVSHKGTSVHCGHYVSHIHATEDNKDEWILFNDDRVVLVPDGVQGLPDKDIYIIVLQRIDER